MFSLKGRQAGSRRLPVEHPGGRAGELDASAAPTCPGWCGEGGTGLSQHTWVQGAGFSRLGNSRLRMASLAQVLNWLLANTSSTETGFLFFLLSYSWFFLVLRRIDFFVCAELKPC